MYYDKNLRPFQKLKVDSILHSDTNIKRYQHTVKVSDPHTIVDNMHKAIDGLGTKDNLFENVLNSVNECNASDVWELWKKFYGKEYNENFYESFINDADKSQRAKFLEKLLTLFRTRNKM